MLKDKRGWPIFALMTLITLLAVAGGLIVVLEKPEAAPDMANSNKRTLNISDPDDETPMTDVAAGADIKGAIGSRFPSGAVPVLLKTEIALPVGYRDPGGILHNKGFMRPATAADIEYAQKDGRAGESPAYAGLLLLGRVVSIDGAESGPDMIEKLYAEDLYYLMSIYREINGKAVPNMGYMKYAPSGNSDSSAYEYNFSLPRGYVDEDGNLHREGIMRRATAADEFFALSDPRVQSNPAYMTVLLLSRVIADLGELGSVTPYVIERLSASDFTYLQELYIRVNGSGASGISVSGLEYEFSLPKGYAGEDGRLIRDGTMRLSSDADETLAMKDPRVQSNPAYFIIILMSRVVTGLGDIHAITPEVIESLPAEDLCYLQEFYCIINGTDSAATLPQLPQSDHE